jgi:hypothetical protein
VDDEQPHRHAHDRPVAMQRRNIRGRPVDLAIGGGHGGAEAGPMSFAKFMRDDEVERLADRIGGGMSEQCLRSGIPDANHAGRLCKDECWLGHDATVPHRNSTSKAHSCEP